MSFRLKPLCDQVVVITGASSGIGLSTARLAAHQGASLVLCSRNGPELTRIAKMLRSESERITTFSADVADKDAVQSLADHAFETFGRIDTWINSAGVGLFGRLTETDMQDKRRLFEVNFWGAVYGCRAAIPYLWENGGALVNIGWNAPRSEWLLQGAVAATKDALKTYTRALRQELESENSPISVSLILPSSVNTPLYDHARHRTRGLHPSPPLPTYLPETVARAILTCAQKAVPELKVGGTGFLKLYPAAVCDLQPDSAEGNLYTFPDVEGKELGRHALASRSVSIRTQSRLHPWIVSFLGLSSLLSAITLLARSRMRHARQTEREFQRNRDAAYIENIAA